MKNVFIVGGAGMVECRLAQKLSEQGNTPRSWQAPAGDEFISLAVMRMETP